MEERQKEADETMQMQREDEISKNNVCHDRSTVHTDAMVLNPHLKLYVPFVNSTVGVVCLCGNVE